MGREVVKTVLNDPDLQLVTVVDKANGGKDIGEVIGVGATGLMVQTDLEAALRRDAPQVMVDFSTPATVLENIRTALFAKVHVVVGTTGIPTENLQEIDSWAAAAGANVLIAPNFAVGALLMMRFAALAARYFPSVEIIELHHDQKLDAPSGTAMKTADMILAGRNENKAAGIARGEEKIKGVRGGEMNGIRLHSIRLPGLIAHQEVIFGGEGQTLTIRHDSLSRESFMPGVALAVKRIEAFPGLTYGLDKILFDN